MISERAHRGAGRQSISPNPRQTTGRTDEQRHAGHRARTLLKGKIIIRGGMMSPDCVIRDLSPDGARVRVSHTILLPSSVGLLVIKDGVLFDAVVAWRKGDEAGLAFSDRRDIRGADDPSNARAHALWVEHAPRQSIT
jgi:hypothetical protein